MSVDVERSKTILVIPMRRPDEEPLARYMVQAAHPRRGAEIVLDVRDARGLADRLAPLVEEFAATAAGNDQALSLLGGSLGERGPRSHDTLSQALREIAPPDRLPFDVTLTLPSSLDDLPAVRGYLEHVHRRLHPEDEGFELPVLVDEICQNAIENSPSNQSLYELVFDCDRSEVRLEVSNTVDDPGLPQRIMKRRLRSFDDSGRYLGDRGRGLFLIARLADRLEIRTGDGERITVVACRAVRSRDAEPAGSGAAGCTGGSSGDGTRDAPA